MIITRRPLFYWIFHRHLLLQMLLLLIILVSIFFRVLPLEIQKRIINVTIQLRQLDLLLLYCAFYLGAVVLSGTLKYVYNVLHMHLGQKILVEIRSELYEHILKLPLMFFRRTPPGTVITSLAGELNAVGHFLGGALVVPVASAFTLLAFAGYMIYLNPFLALLILSIYPLEIIVIPILQKRLNRLNQERVDVTRAMSNATGEAISGIHEIHANASYRLEQEKFCTYVRRLFRLMGRLFLFKYGIKFTNNLFQNMGPFLLFLIGGAFAIQGRFTLGALVAFLSAFEKVYDPWKELIEYYQAFQDAQVRYRRVMEYFDTEPESELAPSGRMPYQLQGSLDVIDLSYMIEERIQLLDQVTLRLSPGEQLALVGFSGSGKSTLAMLLGQLYRYKRGHVRMDGRELNQLTKMDVSRNIGFVAQHPFIFSGTIRENILYGCQSLSFDAAAADPAQHLPDTAKILSIVNAVGLDDDVTRFGLNTVISRERCDPLVGSFFRMRHLVHRRLGEKMAQVVEFYDVNQFQRYASIYSNLMFGDVHNPAFKLENLPRNRIFLKFLDRTDLYVPLIQLGKNLARQTVMLLKDLEDDAFFFEASPIQRDQFEAYSELVSRLESDTRKSLPRTDKAMLLTLALRYVPARHKMVAITPSLQAEIVKARQTLMQQLWHVKLDRCIRATERLTHGKDPGPPEQNAFTDFFPYCPTGYLYSQSLLDNILFGNLKFEQTESLGELRKLLIDLLEKENLLNEVMDIGLDFEVGSKGDRLSGGQRQKIALARAFLKEPSLLILDEATANLDNISQARVRRFMDTQLKAKTTVISVIHRLDLARNYDKICVLKSGRVMETGTYQELMRRRGIFYDLVRGK